MSLIVCPSWGVSVSHKHTLGVWQLVPLFLSVSLSFWVSLFLYLTVITSHSHFVSVSLIPSLSRSLLFSPFPSLMASPMAVKWWKRMFFHLVDISLVNGWILHNIAAEKPMTHLHFWLAVAKNLLEQNLIMKKRSFCLQL